MRHDSLGNNNKYCCIDTCRYQEWNGQLTHNCVLGGHAILKVLTHGEIFVEPSLTAWFITTADERMDRYIQNSFI